MEHSFINWLLLGTLMTSCRQVLLNQFWTIATTTSTTTSSVATSATASLLPTTKILTTTKTVPHRQVVIVKVMLQYTTTTKWTITATTREATAIKTLKQNTSQKAQKMKMIPTIPGKRLSWAMALFLCHLFKRNGN